MSVFLNAQSGGFKREYKLPNAFQNVAKAVFETTPNNYIMGGFVFDTLNGSYTNRLTLFGINQQGQRTWTKKYGSSKFEYLDNLWVSRWFYKQGSNLYHAGCVRDSNNKYLGVLIKFNLNGDSIWQNKFYDDNYDVIPLMVTGSVDGGFLITGYVQQVGNQPVLLIKTNVVGNELWRKYINKSGTNTHDGKAIIQDTSSKKIIIVGHQKFGNDYKDNILICDSLGNKLSQNSYCGSLGGWLNDLIQTKDKKIVAVGKAIYPQIFSGSNLTRSYAVKFDFNSPESPIWKIDNFDKLAKGNSFTCVRELNNEVLLFSGGLDTMQQNSLPLNGLNRMTKFDKNGNMLWNRHYDYSKNPNANNNITTRSLNLAINGDWLAAIQIGNASPDPFFFVRYDSTGCDSTSLYCTTTFTSNIYEVSNNAYHLVIYPNPVKSTLNLSFSNLKFITQNLTFKILDVYGRVIREDEIKIETQNSLNISDLEKGIYFMQLYNMNKLIATKKIMKE
ncbi:MAG: T9SS type A sorting domain-containing protein [Sphingobacteriaceae bacterium]|nr:T9SS type A sorting domain-containing protein [Sphingobacteriaceae bacterium]